MSDVIGTPLQISGALTKAASAFQSNNLAKAAAIFTRILDSVPDQFDALHMLGLVEARKGRLEETQRPISQDARGLTKRSTLTVNSQSASAR